MFIVLEMYWIYMTDIVNNLYNYNKLVRQHTLVIVIVIGLKLKLERHTSSVNIVKQMGIAFT